MKRTSRRLLMPMLIIMLALLVCGCTRGSFTVTQATEISTSTRMSMSHKRFSGFKETSFKVQEGETITVRAEITTEAGSLNAWIGKDGEAGAKAYQGNDIPTSEFTVTLFDAGTYTIHVAGEKHQGSYDFTWGES